MESEIQIDAKCDTGQISILQLTDMHLFADENGKLLGVRTADSFKAVLETIVNQSMPYDCIIVTGDVSQDYSAESYQRFASLIKLLDTPVFFVPGNHDDGPLMYNVLNYLGINTQKYLRIGSWQFIFLNSEVYAVAHGWVERSEIEYMIKKANEHPDLNTAICIHHLPHLVGSRWLDTQTLHNQDEFIGAINRLPNVRMVLSGHVHQEYDKTVDNVRYIATPSTSIQFEPKSTEFALDIQGPGWRYLTLEPNGAIHTKVYRLPTGRFLPDLGVGGY